MSAFVNKLRPQEYAVNEVFLTLQGEGVRTGAPALFVRLQGCDVGCPWCDTKHTWLLDPASLVWPTGAEPSINAVAAKDATPTSLWSWVRASDIAARLHATPNAIAVVTGGEPAMHDLTALVAALEAQGTLVEIETSGTHALVGTSARTWVTVSPKLEMPGQRILDMPTVRRANCLKMPVGKQADVDKLLTLLSVLGDERPPYVYLQPLSQSHRATELCVEAATRHGWRVSLQAHKYAGLR